MSERVEMPSRMREIIEPGQTLELSVTNDTAFRMMVLVIAAEDVPEKVRLSFTSEDVPEDVPDSLDE